MKRLLIVLLALGLTSLTTGCSSSAPKDGAETAQADGESFPEEGQDDFSDDSATKTADESGEQPADQPADPAADSQQMAETPPAEGGDDLSLDEPTDVAAQEVPVAEDQSLESANEFPETVASNDQPLPGQEPVAAAPTDEPVFKTEEPPTETVADVPAFEAPAPAPAPYYPLQKIKSAAFEKSGALLNRVYIARQEDTIVGVSDKLYGENRKKDLVKWNGYLKNRDLKVGDKVYYSSPTNPNDTNMLVYYEEKGVPAQTYTSKDGENVRVVSKELLGHADSWKEVWSTNPALESKGDMPPGTELKYWPEGATATPVQMAATETPPAVEPVLDPTNAPPPFPADPVIDPSNTMAANVPPPPPVDPTASASPPPPAQAMVEPPPPPPPAEAPPKKVKSPVDEAGEEDSTLLLAAAGVMLLVASGMFVFIRKRRAARIDLSQTQV